MGCFVGRLVFRAVGAAAQSDRSRQQEAWIVYFAGRSNGEHHLAPGGHFGGPHGAQGGTVGFCSLRLSIPRRLVTALLFSVVLVAMAPFFGDLQEKLRDLLPSAFTRALGAVFGVAMVAALVLAALRIRDRRLLRYSLLAVWLLLLAGQLTLWSRSSADPISDFVYLLAFSKYDRMNSSSCRMN